jgi:hypothetical protein
MSKIEVNAIEPQSGTTLTIGASGDIITIPAGSAAAPVITTTGDTNTGMFFPAADTIGFAEGGAEAMRITSNGNLNIGNSRNLSAVQLLAGTNGASYEGIGVNNALIQSRGAAADVYIRANTSIAENYLITEAAESISLYQGVIGFSNAPSGTAGNPITFTERMRIDSSGNVLVAKTSSNAGVVGCELGATGTGIFTRTSDILLLLNRLGTDGQLVRFQHADVEEGNISVSGNTVSYNGFTGSHWSRFIDESKPDVLRGTVMESLDEMIDWYHVEFEVSTTEKDKDGNDVVKTTTQKKPYALKANEQEGDVITYNFEGTDYQATIVKQVDVKHVMSKISDTVEAKNVYGVFSAWDNDDLINNDFYVASVGSYVVRIKAGQVVSKGDLLQSNGDGTAKVQADDMIRASTFAKVLSNTVIETYEDGSFIVPCSLMC